jgi:hypothetical protein
MPLKTLFAVTLISAIFLSGCHADAGDANAGSSAEVQKIERPKADAQFSTPAAPVPAPGALPASNQEEIVDLSLG